MENSNVFEITIKVNVVCKDTLEELEARTENVPDIIDLLNTELSEDIREWRVEEIERCEIQEGCAIPMPRTDRWRITTVARRLTRQHNNDEHLVSGYIYLVDLETGRIGECVAGYAATQFKPGDKLYGHFALLRVGHGRMTYKEAQRFLDAKGVGW